MALAACPHSTRGVRPLSRTHSRPDTTTTPCAGTSRRTGALQQCRVTNTAKEFWDEIGEAAPNREEGEWIETIQAPDPTRTMEQQVKRTWLEGVNNTLVDVKDTEYWFTPPPEGWIRERHYRKYSEQADVEFADARHFGEGRTPLEELQEGQLLTGEVTDVWLYHGVEVDIGAQFDGLIPIMEEEFPDVGEALEPGTQITVRVHKIRTPATLWRWPIQLTVVDPAGIQDLIKDPDEWTSPIDARGWELDDLKHFTGRNYEAMKYFMQADPEQAANAVQMLYGQEEPDIEEITEPLDAEERAFWHDDGAIADAARVVERGFPF